MVSYEEFITWAQASNGGQIQADLYLPMILSGVPVLVYEGHNTYRVDNSQLKADAASLAFRRTKRLDDQIPQVAGGARFGTTVRGSDDGDGWLKVGYKEYAQVYSSSS